LTSATFGNERGVVFERNSRPSDLKGAAMAERKTAQRAPIKKPVATLDESIAVS